MKRKTTTITEQYDEDGMIRSRVEDIVEEEDDCGCCSGGYDGHDGVQGPSGIDDEIVDFRGLNKDETVIEIPNNAVSEALKKISNDDKKRTRDSHFEYLVKPLFEFLNDECDPHTSILINSVMAELIRGDMAFEIWDYVKD